VYNTLSMMPIVSSSSSTMMMMMKAKITNQQLCRGIVSGTCYPSQHKQRQNKYCLVQERKKKKNNNNNKSIEVRSRATDDRDDEVLRLQRESEQLLTKQKLLLEQLEARKLVQMKKLEKLHRARATDADDATFEESGIPGVVSEQRREERRTSAATTKKYAVPAAAPTPLPIVTMNSPTPSPPRTLTAEEIDRKEQKQEEITKTTTEMLCREKLNIVMVASECAPFSKTGGLGDVMQSLPKALAKRGHRVMTVVPRYKEYKEGIDTGKRIKLKVLGQDVEVGFFHHYRDGVDIVFVDHNSYHHVRDSIYSGDRQAQQFRNALLCQAALELPFCISPGDVPYGDENLIFVANDWHAALLPVFLQGYFRDYGKYEFARSCFIVHNMAHQGRGPLNEFDRLGLDAGKYKDKFYLDDPFGGECMNIMQAGLRLATKVIAVSEGYAWEISTDMGGWGLAPCVREFGQGKLSGIVNGIDYDEWSPNTDEHLMRDGYATYQADGNGLDSGKKVCKLALQRELGLPEDERAMLIGFIGRLDDQKGVDLITDSEHWFRDNHVQLVMLGSGREDLENALRGMESRNKDKIRGWVGFSVQMAHRITAACDCLLMPSRFEPCGLNQLYAMRYGTIPIVHAVGGLRDTVTAYDPFNNSGTGWRFDSAEAHKLRETMNYALGTFKDHRESFRGIQMRAMAKDYTWDQAAKNYEDRFIDAKYSW
jgi:starch synthase